MKSWLKRNERILNEWEKIEGNVSLIAQMKQNIRRVERNLEIIDQYVELPKKLSAWAHIADQYIVEIMSFIESFTTQIVSWLQDNANRFSKRVDTITLLVGIVKTWQILIDVSTNRHSKCAQCRQDNYDFYSCKLSLLCVDLPILPIPNFHLPNILLDLSNLNIGLDFVLPRISFVPKRVPLIQLPDLPAPHNTNININVDIYQIPLLPPPPELPALPELTMDIDIKLPRLPPAPKIPKISPAIEVVIDLLDLVSTI